MADTVRDSVVWQALKTTWCQPLPCSAQWPALSHSRFAVCTRPAIVHLLAGPAVFRAIHALACCLPPPLSHQALSTTAALRLVVLAQQVGGAAREI